MSTNITTRTRTTTTNNSFSSFLSTKTSSGRTQSCGDCGVCFHKNEITTKPTKVCPVISLSERDEEILIVQNLKTRIEPNHNISEAVNRAIARHTERVDRQIEIVENRFKSINDEIERRILEASRMLDESLIVIDNSLSGILDDLKSDECIRFDPLQKCFLVVNNLINERNQIIKSFMDALHDFEKERTALIKDCYQQLMLDVKQLSGDSYERLYEKYLKNYNMIKLGNFRTYEDLRYKLVQWSGILHQDFVLKACDVKAKIIKNLGKSFEDKFITNAKTIISDRVEYTQSTLIRFLNDLSELFGKLIRTSENKMDIEFVLNCLDSLKNRLKKIDEINENVITLHNDGFEVIRLLLTRTFEEFDNTVLGSDEFLSPGEAMAINNAMVTKTTHLQQENMKITLEVQLFLSDVKNAISNIGEILNPVIEIIYGHFGRFMKARDIVCLALNKTFKTNDSELEMLEDSFSVELNSLVQTSDETEVRKFELKCINALNNIKDRMQVNRNLEMKVISDYIDLLSTELEVIRSEVKVIINLFPESFKPLRKLNDAMQGESWSTSIKTTIASFESTMNHFQHIIYERFRAFILELKSLNLMNNELAWTSLLEQGIDERFNVTEYLLQLRTIRVQYGYTKNRINEIQQHKNIFTRHTKSALETSDDLKHKTNELFKEFDLKKTLILKNIEKINTDELSITELTEAINELKYQIYLMASEINDKYKSHYNDVESKYQTIENSTLKLMKSIKMFPEGGNYGHEEAIKTVHMLKHLSKKMLDMQTSILGDLKENSYESVTEIKTTLLELIKPVEIELDKKVLKQKYYSINKLLNVTVSQEILNLEKMLDSLHTKLNVAKKTFEKNDVVELSKCWSEILLEANAFIDFVVESYKDIQALLKYNAKKSIWNTESEVSYLTSNIAVNSKHTFTRGKFKFEDYCKTFISRSVETITDRPRFLKNVYSAIFHYVSESQINAADLVIIESSDNTWIDEEPNTAALYSEIMVEAVKSSRATALQSELIWIFKLSEFFDLTANLYAMEGKFKNAVLATYHEESVTSLNEIFGKFRVDTEAVRKQLKTARQEFHYKLKPSHGHPRNTWRLESLMADFQRFNAECMDTLSGTRDRIAIGLEKIDENYKAMCPKDVLAAATVYVKCYAKLKTLLDHVDDSTSIASRGSNALLKSLAKHGVEQAISNVKSRLRMKSGTIFWSDNSQLWAYNVQVFSRICRKRFGDVQTFGVVEKAKMVDWATAFVRDVERVKELNSQYVTV